ncbi:hypothetical protein E4T56_gene12454 [Termitomyces sp. T112]|nr:hypothetical protein E4T56_gene12454 [Termitomyces sp. T112]
MIKGHEQATVGETYRRIPSLWTPSLWTTSKQAMGLPLKMNAHGVDEPSDVLSHIVGKVGSNFRGVLGGPGTP